MSVFHRALPWLDALFGYSEPLPARLDCGCLDAGAHYLCLYCDRATCEQHRLDPHQCVTPTLCPEGRPQAEGPWLERGGRYPDGTEWRSCPCGSVHIRPAGHPFLREE